MTQVNQYDAQMALPDLCCLSAAFGLALSSC